MLSILSLFAIVNGYRQYQPRAPAHVNRNSFLKISTAAATSAIFGRADFAFASQSAIEGRYSDPNHPKGYRNVKINGDRAEIEGSDSGSTREWVLQATLKKDSLFIDFTPKGYPAVLEGKFDGSGLVFPDGNKWPKK